MLIPGLYVTAFVGALLSMGTMVRSWRIAKKRIWRRPGDAGAACDAGG
jgi:hypothetical protein